MENPAFVMELDGECEKSKNGIKSEKIYSFEEAVALTETGKYHFFLLIVCGFCFMSVMVETMGVSIILPFLKCDLESTVGDRGILASSGFLGIVLSSHIMGFLADTWGRVRTLRAAFVCSSISTVISAFSANIWMLIVLRFFNGFFISGGQACVFSFMGEFHGHKTRVKYVTLLSTFMPIGLMVLPGIAIGILPMQLDAMVLGVKFTPWRLLLLVNCGFSVIALCGLLLTPESPKYVFIQGRHEEALHTLRRVFARNTGRKESDYPVKQVVIEISGASISNVHSVKDAFKLVWSQTIPLFYRERVLHTINICCIMFVIFGISQGTFMWFPTMLDQLVTTKDTGLLVCETMYALGNISMNSTASAASCSGPVSTSMFEVLITNGAAFTVIFLIFAFTIDYVGKKNLLMIWLIIASSCCLAIHWVSSFVMSVILLVLIMGVGSCGGLVSTISIEFFPTNISAMAMCLIMMFGRLGAVAGSNIFGAAILTSCDTLFYIYVGIIAVVGCFALLLPDKRERKKKDIVEPTTTIYTIGSNLPKSFKQQQQQ